jgi:hypothetical protein
MEVERSVVVRVIGGIIKVFLYVLGGIISSPTPVCNRTEASPARVTELPCSCSQSSIMIGYRMIKKRTCLLVCWGR